ncbi:hypothetical protein KP79_PYT25375 [Mizuhopecten yessoensis]|uniref:Uncharacterized protein n=1 Tax=Mizuhopecten yessoensis TaxID=6573 RepID=A0A210R121_MIZYE|nr:hypothetical protein KP79_PYT25375 [Mizuhopecten yessoensis]
MDVTAASSLSPQLMDSVKLIQGITDPSVIQEVVTQLLDNALFKDTLLSSLGISNLHHQLATLETRVDDMVQYSRRNCLKLRGIPEHDNEGSSENTDQIILNLCNETLGVMVTQGDITRSHRVGPKSPSRPRDIIVRFISYNIRAQVYGARFSLFSPYVNEASNASQKSSPEAHTPPPFYINEALTKQRASVFTKARFMKSSGCISGTWTQDGRIVLRHKDGTRTQVTSLREIASYPDPPPPIRRSRPRTLADRDRGTKHQLVAPSKISFAQVTRGTKSSPGPVTSTPNKGRGIPTSNTFSPLVKDSNSTQKSCGSST